MLQEELANDFNVPAAMGAFFGMIKDFNRRVLGEISKSYIDEVKKCFDFMRDATGLVHDNTEEILKELNKARKHLSGTSSDNDEEVKRLLIERKEVRALKNFKRSDEIRNRLNELGVVVKDNPDGSATWSYK